MCDTSGGGRRFATVRPRWGMLYATVLPHVAALGAVEIVRSPGALRIALRFVLALAMFAAMAVWLRANRSAFDVQSWCDCAGRRMTIRVIESRAPTPMAPLEPVVGRGAGLYLRSVVTPMPDHTSEHQRTLHRPDREGGLRHENDPDAAGVRRVFAVRGLDRQCHPRR